MKQNKYSNLKYFIGKSQVRAIAECLIGEEGEYYDKLLNYWEDIIARMPKTYQTEGVGLDAIAYLHYFGGGCDWWITERDMGSPDDTNRGEQLQAFGLACLNGDTANMEVGYISIPELLAEGAELDIYWAPKPLSKIIQEKRGGREVR